MIRMSLPAAARPPLLALFLVGPAAVACQTPADAIETTTAAAQACGNQCGEVCLKPDSTCGTACNYWERIENGEAGEMFCRQTTCGGGATTPCKPPTDKPPGTPGPPGQGPGGFCGPHLCQVDTRQPPRLVGQSLGWGYEQISESPVRFRKYRAVINHYARPQTARNNAECNITCCDYVYKREHCEGTVTPWGGTRACFPPGGGDRAICL